MDRTTQEEWRPIKGYEGEFLISSEGRAMNSHGLVLKTFRDGSNNKCIKIKDKRIRIAYAVAAAFIPNPNRFKYQGYKDENKDNCSIDNIIWTTADFTNDGTSRSLVIVKDDEVIEFESISKTADFLKSSTKTIKMSANNTERNIKVNGYYIAWSNDRERIMQLIGGVECVKSLEGEEWKNLPELNNEYMVSNLGRVKRIKNKERLVKTTVQKNGYVYVTLTINKKSKCFKTSRLVAKAFLPNPNNYEEVDHINADKLNNTVSNLEWVTPEENKRRAIVLGLRTPHIWTEEEKLNISNKVKATLASKKV